MDLGKDLSNLNKEDILSALGLQPRTQPTDYILPVLGIFGAGLLIGTGLGMLVAPRTGRAMRRELGKRVNDVADRVTTVLEDARN